MSIRDEIRNCINNLKRAQSELLRYQQKTRDAFETLSRFSFPNTVSDFQEAEKYRREYERLKNIALEAKREAEQAEAHLRALEQDGEKLLQKADDIIRLEVDTTNKISDISTSSARITGVDRTRLQHIADAKTLRNTILTLESLRDDLASVLSKVSTSLQNYQLEQKTWAVPPPPSIQVTEFVQGFASSRYKEEKQSNTKKFTKTLKEIEKPEKSSDGAFIGTVTGMTLGFIVAGPVGAFLGGLFGGAFGSIVDNIGCDRDKEVVSTSTITTVDTTYKSTTEFSQFDPMLFTQEIPSVSPLSSSYTLSSSYPSFTDSTSYGSSYISSFSPATSPTSFETGFTSGFTSGLLNEPFSGNTFDSTFSTSSYNPLDKVLPPPADIRIFENPMDKYGNFDKNPIYDYSGQLIGYHNPQHAYDFSIVDRYGSPTGYTISLDNTVSHYIGGTIGTYDPISGLVVPPEQANHGWL